MIPREIISKAIEGGWKSPSNTVDEAVRGDIVKLCDTELAYIALDLTFWHALGKALGWLELNKIGQESCYNWRGQALEFLDLILTGGDTEKFWESLLK